ncbi:putative fatty-acid--CoA ligase [Gordonia paraffinivorans NBRC 108238]|uniref:Acyl-CoA synthetase n=2 Tax=Gordonia paraffinivorans TaxID=175628 RepID=A0ABQ0IRW7_9ACTN|nr:putative fatty-acid--CoA ligase [Gordonia paraffinivorans NBRC 108238]
MSQHTPHMVVAMGSADSLVSAFRSTVRATPDKRALRSSDGRIDLTWREYQCLADDLAAGLTSLDIGPGSTVAILMGNRPEWQLVDTATLITGATPFSLYANAAGTQNAELVRRARARVVIGEPDLLAALQLEPYEHPVTFIEVGPTDLTKPLTAPSGNGAPTTLFSLRQLGARTPFEPPAICADSIATLIYTSGTTGPPKGVELTHRSLLFIARFIDSIVPLAQGRTISYLPHAHIVDRVVGHYTALVCGSSVTTISDARALFDVLPDIRPTLFTSVPRIWQRLHAQMLREIDNDTPAARTAIYEALNDARTVIELREAGQPVPATLAAKVDEADAACFLPMRKRVGLDAAEWIITGSAPLPRATHLFFAALGMPLHDLWGLSETSGIATFSAPGDHRLGTVGRALPGTEVILADDGEVLIRGPHLAVGYRDDPAATAASFDAEGWFHSGDLGEWDADQLRIVGRKKELIISAGGENMSPTRIEDVVASASPLVSSVVVIGDQRPFNIALIVPDFDRITSELGIKGTPTDLLVNDELRSAFDRIVDDANAQLSRHERIRRHALLPQPWTVDSGELTPTLKIRRTDVERKYADVIDSLYADNEVDSYLNTQTHRRA